MHMPERGFREHTLEALSLLLEGLCVLGSVLERSPRAHAAEALETHEAVLALRARGVEGGMGGGSGGGGWHL